MFAKEDFGISRYVARFVEKSLMTSNFMNV